MGWNDRMDFPEAYGPQYARDFGYSSFPSVRAQAAGPRKTPTAIAQAAGPGQSVANAQAAGPAQPIAIAEVPCAHETSRPTGDGFEECIDCGATFWRPGMEYPAA